MHELPWWRGSSSAWSPGPDAPGLVGGDFSDAFVLDDGQVAILIGDVAGKGVEAAGLTETVRGTVRAFARVDRRRRSCWARRTQLLRHDPDGPHVTAFYCLLEPRTGHLAYASAGHPAPIHLGPNVCRPLAVPFGPPLGSFEHSYECAHAMLTLDDSLVLYTDGVTEARRAGEMYGERRLIEAAANLWVDRPRNWLRGWSAVSTVTPTSSRTTSRWSRCGWLTLSATRLPLLALPVSLSVGSRRDRGC